MDDVVIMMPDGVVLTSIKQSGTTISLEGNAQSNAQISALMRNIEEQAGLDKPNLRLIESRDTEGLNRFTLIMKQGKPEAEPEAEPESEAEEK
jgi:type IV pilus assembly protein PilN